MIVVGDDIYSTEFGSETENVFATIFYNRKSMFRVQNWYAEKAYSV